MAIAFIGDIHGDFDALVSIQNRAVRENPDTHLTFIQVGDLGYYSGLKEQYYRSLPRKFYWIHGNHDETDSLVVHSDVVEVWHNAFYIPNGIVREIDGKRIAFFGGASSVDKAWRKPGISWWASEVPTKEQLDRFNGIDKVDLMVCHTAPQHYIDRRMNHLELERMFELPKEWYDPTSVMIQELWERWGRPHLVCGHLHRSDLFDNIKVIGINELYIFS